MTSREDAPSINLLEGSDSDDDETVDPFESKMVPNLSQSSVTNTAQKIENRSNLYSESSISPKDAYVQSKSEDLCSPATKTLNALSQSQQSDNLQYDLSELENNVAETLLQVSRSNPLVSVQKSNSVLYEDDSSCSTTAGEILTIQSDSIRQIAKKTEKPLQAADSVSSSSTSSKNRAQQRAVPEKRVGGSISVHLINYADGQIAKTYPTMTAAAKEIGVSRWTVAALLYGTYKAKHYKGWTFKRGPRRGNDRSSAKSTQQEKLIQQVNRRRKECVASFKSVSAAESHTNISQKTDSPEGWTFKAQAVSEYGDATISSKRKSPKPVRQHDLNSRTESEASSGHSVEDAGEKKSQKTMTCRQRRSHEHETIFSKKRKDPNVSARSLPPNVAWKQIQKTDAGKLGTAHDTPIWILKDETMSDEVYQLHKISFSEVGPLGFCIRRELLPRHLLALLLRTCRLHGKSLQCELQGLYVPSLKPVMASRNINIAAGDWLLYVEGPNPGLEEKQKLLSGTMYADFDSVRSFATTKDRPLSFVVAREVGATAEARAHRPFESCNMKSTSEVLSGDERIKLDHATTVTLRNQCVGLDSKDTLALSRTLSTSRAETPKMTVTVIGKESGNAPVPFCALCNKRNTRPIHHAWCPKSPSFANSGAKEIFERIVQGIQIGCKQCIEEYNSGRPTRSREHSKQCLEGFSPPTKASPPRSTHSKMNRSGSVGCSDGENDLAYRNPKNKRRSLERLVLSKRKSSAKVAINDSVSRTLQNSRPGGERTPALINNQAQNHPESKISAGFVRSDDDQVALEKEGLRLPVHQRDNPVEAPCRNVASMQLGRLNAASDRLHVVWETCENVWGHNGYMEDDVIIYSTGNNMSCREKILPSVRFELEPFESSKNYQTTHCSPHDGYQALVLQRDPSALRSWGFSATRHEHGGACLVSEVEPCSPAQAARLLGSGFSERSRASVRKNDMIVAVNGKNVGGMTTLDLEVELEHSGSEIVLLVSRYRFAKKMQDKLDQQAKLENSKIDDAINDFQTLDWIDANDIKERADQTRSSTVNRQGITRPTEFGFNGRNQLQKSEPHFVPYGNGRVTPNQGIPLTFDGSDSDSCALSEAPDDSQKLLALPDGKKNESVAPGHCLHNVEANNSIATDRTMLEGSKALETSGKVINGEQAPGENGLQALLDSDSCGHSKSPDDSQKLHISRDAKKNKSVAVSGNSLRNGEENTSISKGRTILKGSKALASTSWEVRPGERASGDNGLQALLRDERENSPFHISEIKATDEIDIDEETFLSDAIGNFVKEQKIKESKGYFSQSIDTNKGSRISKRKRKISSYTKRDKQYVEDIDGDTDDGNAWTGCVCGVVHDTTVSVFWIQCECCDTWYNSAESCLGFTIVEAASVENWVCWGCPAIAAPDHTTLVSRNLQSPSISSIVDDLLTSPLLPHPEAAYDVNETEKSGTLTPTKVACSTFEKGDLVYVKEHGWSGVNNSEGAAKILKAYLDKDEGLVYDIKYVIGGISKAVLPEYLTSYVL